MIANDFANTSCSQVAQSAEKPLARLLLFLRILLRGKDLNLRPLGYEPNELPLLHPASMRLFTIRVEYGIVNGARTTSALLTNLFRCMDLFSWELREVRE